MLDVFDDWRRAVGVAASARRKRRAGPARKPALRRTSNVPSRGSWPAARQRSSALHAARGVAACAESLALSAARRSRAATRGRAILDAGRLDVELVEAAAPSSKTPQARRGARRRRELAPFGAACRLKQRPGRSRPAFERLVREALGLPISGIE